MFLNTVSKILRKPRVLSKKIYINCYCTVTNTAPQPDPVKNGIVLGVYTGENNEVIFTPASCKINEQLGGRLKELCIQSSLPIGVGNSRVFNNICDEYWSIAVVGLGSANPGINDVECLDETQERVRIAAGIGAKKLAKQGVHAICMDGMGHPESAAEGSTLSTWRFQKNKSKQNLRTVPTVELFEDRNSELWQRGILKAESQNMVRLLCDLPSNQMTPIQMAQFVISELCPCGITVLVHDKDWIELNKMRAFLTVAKGSCAQPLFLELTYCGACPDDKPILLVGKSVTYDTGGLCLKNKLHVARHRAELAGGAVVVAAMKAAAMFQLPVNITGLIPLCENLPSGMAMKVGDVVSVLNGKSIKIEDTDNEGRLCMVDAILYGLKVHKPKLLIDLATETKGATCAFGSACSGVFTNSHSLWQEVKRASVITGDRVWRLPLWKYYAEHVTRSSSVDVLNRGIGKGDVCLAAAFLAEFIECIDWIHFDINGVGMKSHDKNYQYLKRGRMTGRPVRTLIQLLYQLACPDPCLK